ncbi:Unknown protein, partial [Striga hermonthica]
ITSVISTKAKLKYITPTETAEVENRASRLRRSKTEHRERGGRISRVEIAEVKNRESRPRRSKSERRDRGGQKPNVETAEVGNRASRPWRSNIESRDRKGRKPSVETVEVEYRESRPRRSKTERRDRGGRKSSVETAEVENRESRDYKCVMNEWRSSEKGIPYPPFIGEMYLLSKLGLTHIAVTYVFSLHVGLSSEMYFVEQKMPSEDVTWPKTRFTGPIRPRSDIYYRFNRDYGHTSENCRHLKDEIERMIRAGYLKEFVYHDRVKGKGRRRCREDSEERSDKDEEGDSGDGRDGRGKKPRRDGDKGGHGGDAPMKRGTIYMISGGPTDGDSNRARKEHARAVKRKREEVGIMARMPVINFKAEDAEGVVLPHNDALVITAEVAGFYVKRVFIDTESSVDVMFYDCFMQINKELKPVTTALYGFNGEEVMPMGEVSFPVALGSGELRKVRMVRFAVVGAESSYNIIMGRTNLNAFQTVVST